MTTTPRPFVPNPAPELIIPDAAPPPAHMPVRERLGLLALFAGLVMGACLWLMLWKSLLGAGWVTWDWASTVGVLGFVVLVSGAAWCGLTFLKDWHSFRLWLLGAQGDLFARQRGQTVQRRVYVLHYRHAEQPRIPEPPRVITIRTPANESRSNAGDSQGPVWASSRVVVTPPPSQGTTARYDASETQRLERFALPAPPDLPGKAHWMRQYLKPSGTPPSWRTSKPNMSETEWRASCAALVALGELEDLGKGRGFRWIK